MTSLPCHPVEHLSCFIQTVCDQPLLQYFLVVCQLYVSLHNTGALVMFYSKCMRPASLATLWSTCHVLLKVFTANLSCHLVEHLSCFTQSVHSQPLLQPCGALVMFYSKCIRPASHATLWSTCHILLKLCATSLSCHPVEHLSHFTQNVHNQPLLQPCGALVMFYSHCM